MPGDAAAGPVALNLSVLGRALQMDLHRSSVVQSACVPWSWLNRGGRYQAVTAEAIKVRDERHHPRRLIAIE